MPLSNNEYPNPPGAQALQHVIASWKGLWKDSPIINVLDVSGFRICTIPLHFLQQGHTTLWSDVEYIVRCCVEESGKLSSLKGEELNLDEEAIATNVLYRRTGPLIVHCLASSLSDIDM